MLHMNTDYIRSIFTEDTGHLGTFTDIYLFIFSSAEDREG